MSNMPAGIAVLSAFSFQRESSGWGWKNFIAEVDTGEGNEVPGAGGVDGSPMASPSSFVIGSLWAGHRLVVGWASRR